MTIMKSVLLGSAATLMVVAGAQAADLPTKKGAPAAEYVKVCKIGGIAGFIIPGSDTCLKISGYVQAHFNVGSLAGSAVNQRYQDRSPASRPLGFAGFPDRPQSSRRQPRRWSAFHRRPHRGPRSARSR